MCDWDKATSLLCNFCQWNASTIAMTTMMQNVCIRFDLGRLKKSIWSKLEEGSTAQGNDGHGPGDVRTIAWPGSWRQNSVIHCLMEN